MLFLCENNKQMMENMSAIDNKELLFKAVDCYQQFSQGDKKVIKILLNYERQGIANISVKDIARLAELSTTSVNSVLKKAIYSHLITPTRLPGDRSNRYAFNLATLNEIMQLYLKFSGEVK
jgi:DNA-binding MarR family transcriptional regulator